MSDPSLGSERNVADRREEHPFDASDGTHGAPTKKSSKEKAPLKLLTRDAVG
jgi:hypothetical protein